MILFPAIDIQNGKVVRLRQGRKEDSTVFYENPVETAIFWQKQGASFLHVVDLDGAFDPDKASFNILQKIMGEVNIPVQVGGGIRNVEVCKKYLDCGVERLIIGTTALEQPQVFAQMCSSFPGRIGVSLDADNGKLKTRGWISDSDKTFAAILPFLESAGASFIIYTDIARDGMQEGLNLNSLSSLLAMTSLPVIAAGGVNSLEDIKRCWSLSGKGNLEGIISGRALYEKTLDFKEAKNWLASQKPASASQCKLKMQSGSD